jgi:hypothetical protein
MQSSLPVCDTTALLWRPRLGERVRVCLRPEGDCSEAPHLLGEAGQIGRVVREHPTASAPSHPYLVMFDRPAACVFSSGRHISMMARHYAVDELAPLASLLTPIRRPGSKPVASTQVNGSNGGHGVSHLGATVTGTATQTLQAR